MYETIRWPEAMKPSRSPIHFTNELKVAAMHGPHWIELAKQAPDIFWLTHEKLLKDLASVALARETLHL